MIHVRCWSSTGPQTFASGCRDTVPRTWHPAAPSPPERLHPHVKQQDWLGQFLLLGRLVLPAVPGRQTERMRSAEGRGARTFRKRSRLCLVGSAGTLTPVNVDVVIFRPSSWERGLVVCAHRVRRQACLAPSVAHTVGQNDIFGRGCCFELRGRSRRTLWTDP